MAGGDARRGPTPGRAFGRVAKQRRRRRRTNIRGDPLAGVAPSGHQLAAPSRQLAVRLLRSRFPAHASRQRRVGGEPAGPHEVGRRRRAWTRHTCGQKRPTANGWATPGCFSRWAFGSNVGAHRAAGRNTSRADVLRASIDVATPRRPAESSAAEVAAQAKVRVCVCTYPPRCRRYRPLGYRRAATHGAYVCSPRLQLQTTPSRPRLECGPSGYRRTAMRGAHAHRTINSKLRHGADAPTPFRAASALRGTPPDRLLSPPRLHALRSSSSCFRGAGA